MQPTKWLFGRRHERIAIERVPSTDDEVTLVITSNGDPARTYSFANLFSLARFQNDMEQFLVNTGWSLLEFSPERRSGRDRRTFPRLRERRRWWTDAIGRIADRRDGRKSTDGRQAE